MPDEQNQTMSCYACTAFAINAQSAVYIGIEQDPERFAIACKRIEQAYAQGQLFAPEPPKSEQLTFD